MGTFKPLFAALVLAAAACTSTTTDTEEFRAGAVEADHVCAGACDHIYADGGWKVVLGHKHGPNCGHQLVNGRWVKKPAEPVDAKKVEPPKD
jgi:hypothetical protein